MTSSVILGGAFLLILLLRKGRKTPLEVIKEESDTQIASKVSEYSVESNIGTALEWASFGGGAGAAIGGPFGFVVGTAIGWASGLIKLAIRGGIRMGLEIRRIIRKKYREMGVPANENADDFVLFCTMMLATGRHLSVGYNGKVYLPVMPEGRASEVWEPTEVNSLEGFIDTFWGVLSGLEKMSPELKELMSRNHWNRIPYKMNLELKFLPGGSWSTVGEGEIHEDVPYLGTVKPVVHLPSGMPIKYTGLLKNNAEAFKLAARWAANQFNVSHEAWVNDYIDAIGGNE